MANDPNDNYVMVEGIDYSAQGIEDLRQALIQLRNDSFKHWPDSISATVVLSHAIAILHYMLHQGRVGSPNDKRPE